MIDRDRPPGRHKTPMKAAIVTVALCWAIGGAVPALAAIGVGIVIYALSSSDRLFSALYIAAFCGVGYLAG